MEKGLLEERRGHRAGRTGWRPAALPFFHPGEPRKVQRAEARVTGCRGGAGGAGGAVRAGDSLSTRALMHKGSWRRTQSFLITVPSVAVTHVRVPTPTPTQDLAAFSQLSGSQGAKGAPPRPCLTRPAF